MNNMYDIICKKRDGQVLGEEEIRYFVEGVSKGTIPDYQTSAFLMAIYFQGLIKEEIYTLTDAMSTSGDMVDLSEIKGIKVDKHSTGGVGDKTTLIVSPLVAACGVPIAKMSGGGLGFTGGTIDKLDSIPGMHTALDEYEFIDQVNQIGLAIMGQTAHIAVADKKLYALRDVTGTVSNLGLISSSIMSKKIASGSDALVLDVKCGNGALMEREEDAEALADLMVEIGKSAGIHTMALLSNMETPLGRAIGNSLEVIEAIETLKGQGPEDITELSLTMAGHLIHFGGKADTAEKGKAMAEKALSSGEGLEKFREFVEAQGGDTDVIENYSLLPKASFQKAVIADKSGYVSKVSAKAIGMASQHSGAGRKIKDDDLDYGAGIYLNKKEGEYVEEGETLATVYTGALEKGFAIAREVKSAFEISEEKPELPPIIKKIIR